MAKPCKFVVKRTTFCWNSQSLTSSAYHGREALVYRSTPSFAFIILFLQSLSTIAELSPQFPSAPALALEVSMVSIFMRALLNQRTYYHTGTKLKTGHQSISPKISREAMLLQNPISRGMVKDASRLFITQAGVVQIEA
ncbi:hypothetical protein HYFRA_00007839 [Hymenoscyphus fraxineus]|uniref:Uncharacterized protein n=1 Tax=Hymenoscyphus fraxineus TaxID=746836 RepID=A0A9N9KMB4_9HELO|nr:hypothetical protein HYFRA_00007839 [Hymenoscyphus fraxineus]